jgi:hypothetical protein
MACKTDLPPFWSNSMDDTRLKLLKGRLSDPRWRLDNLYWITNKEGSRIQFKLNWAQENLMNDLHYCNLVLKARQLGFTTFIQIFMLDQCVFNSNIRAGTIAHRLDDAKTIFRDKVKYPYDNLPEALRNARPLISDSSEELVLSNNSSIRVGTSLRSGTLQYLHISEYGKLCAQFADKAREVRTGALNTLEAGQVVFIESTAEGKEGHFFELCEAGQAKQRMGTRLTPLDFRFHFYPWWKEPSYELDPEGVVIGDDLRKYFEKLESCDGIKLSDAKRAWYSKKLETQLEDMKREYPSTPAEAFEASIEGAYYAQQLAQAELQGRIGGFKASPDLPVNTAWDLGVGDSTAIWFWQKLRDQIKLVGYFEASGEGLPFYIDVLKDYQRRHGWTYASHIVPHDAKVKEFSTGRTRIEQMLAAGIRPAVCAMHSVEDGINSVRATLPRCYFDEEACAVGIRHLKSYRKDFDEIHGVWKSKPRHDQSSHAADAFRYMAMASHEVPTETVAAPTPKEIIREMIKPRTYNELWQQYANDLRERDDAELPEAFDDFNQSNTMELK